MSINYSGGYATPRLDLGIALQELEPDPGAFIAEQIFVPFETQERDAKLSVRSRESMLKSVKTRRASKGTFNRIDSKLEDLEYSCDTHGLEGVVDDEERLLYASAFDADMATVEDIRMALWISKERRAASKLFSPTTFTAPLGLYTDASAANPITDPSSDIIGVIIDAVESCRLSSGGMAANALVMSKGNLTALLKNTGIRAQFPGAPRITLQMILDSLMSIFGLERLLVGASMFDAANEDAAAASFTSIWSDDYISVCRVAPGPAASLRTPCIGRTMKWARFSADFAVQQYREEQTMGDVFRAFECVDEHLKDPALGHLVKVR